MPVHKKNRKNIILRGHPLAAKGGSVLISRIVLYGKLAGVSGLCHWCGIVLTWATLCADHLDSDTENNQPSNLVGSCRGCNANREDGTGHGRIKKQPCPICKIWFSPKSRGSGARQQNCSKKCFFEWRRKRNTVIHGSLLGYSYYGCRCQMCLAASARRSRERGRKKRDLLKKMGVK